MSKPTVPAVRTMLCESCGAESRFVLDSVIGGGKNGPVRGDYECETCGWLQTSPQGGFCEVLCSWLTNPTGKPSIPNKDALATYLWQTCQGEIGRFYAGKLADELFALLKQSE